MEDTTELKIVESIRDHVYMLRGEQVMIDSDLADIYGYELKAMNQQVRRNIDRFPEDFMFQMTRDEVDLVKSQFVTSRENTFFSGQGGGRRKLPYAFTEQGIYMLATVLKGELATKQSIFIMRAFREMRHYIKQNQQFVTQAEMHLVSARVSEISVKMSNRVSLITFSCATSVSSSASESSVLKVYFSNEDSHAFNMAFSNSSFE